MKNKSQAENKKLKTAATMGRTARTINEMNENEQLKELMKYPCIYDKTE